MKIIPLSIRDFAIPVPRTGSLEAHAGYSRATAEGQEIHVRVQEKRTQSDSTYESEVKISRTFEREGYQFQIGGRMDGIFTGDTPHIEEIKTSFNIRELSKILSKSTLDHPYNLQLATYGYFYWLDHQVHPELTFHLVSTRNRDFEDLDFDLDVAAYESWLELRLSELVEEAKKDEKRILRRKEASQNFPFPFEHPRPGQTELIQSIEEGMKEKERMMIQAPTGLGKTVGVLYPVLKEALHRGQKVIYITPKNTQHAIAEDAVTRFRETGTPLKSLTITAKSKICFKNEPLCNPDYCEYAKNYYDKLSENKISALLEKKKKLNSRVFKEMGEKYEVCPFELQLEAAKDTDTVICDYNYVFNSSSALEKLANNGIVTDGKPNLVIDEVHNLPARAIDSYSPSLSSIVLDKMREDILKLPHHFKTEAEQLLDDCIQVILNCRPAESSSEQPTRRFGNREPGSKIEPSLHPFLEQDESLRTFLSRYLDADLDIQPRDVVLRLCFYWSQFCEILEQITSPKKEEFFITFHNHPSGGIIKITCCDASEMLRPSYDNYEQVVGFSATLKPFDFYAKLSGLDPKTIKTAEFQSPFAKKNRKLLIIPQISTKYSDRTKNYPKIAEVIQRISSLRTGNYFIFFPSFDFLEKVLDLVQPPSGFTVLRQEREMKAADVESVLEHLRENQTPTLIFAVQGGVFSEGVDYPGNMIIGAFVVGPPLPSFDLEREEMKDYYQKHYGSGFDYAYTFPAMAKAIQAAGRVIRTETDRGIVVLMDSRFTHSNYTQTMPGDWFEKNAGELISSSILKDVTDFWENSN